MKFIVLLVGVVAVGAGVGFALPTPQRAGASDPQSGSAPPPQAPASAQNEAGHFIFDYRRVVAAQSPEVEQAFKTLLEERARTKASTGESLSITSTGDGSTEWVWTSDMGARVIFRTRFEPQGSDTVVSARVYGDVSHIKGQSDVVLTAVANAVPWEKYVPTDELRSDFDRLVSQVERSARAAVNGRGEENREELLAKAAALRKESNGLYAGQADALEAQARAMQGRR